MEKDNENECCVILDDNSDKTAKVLPKKLKVIDITTEKDDCCVILDDDNVDKPVKELTRCLDVLYISSEQEDDDDDYCVILECDPDDPVKVVSHDVSENVLDELVVVAEKGQVACRDYPHARHLCTKFPLSTDPHEKYCDLCHCYVCDIRAPCTYWGRGTSSDDHCHSNDKEEKWRIQRKSLQTKSLQSN
ncbi:hypothetical protein ACHQM5_004098 [Ranunculus cassubicifolius]